jgi:hypothetical protein
MACDCDNNTTYEDLVPHKEIAKATGLSRPSAQRVCAQAEAKMLIRLALLTDPAGFMAWLDDD